MMKDLIDREVVLEELSYTRPSPKDRPQYLQWLADNKAILEVPLVQSDFDEWCTDCKEYDADNHCCPRFNNVIREALNEGQPERKKANWEKDELFGESAYVCTNCETIWTTGQIKNMHYCPTCGSDMREGR